MALMTQRRAAGPTVSLVQQAQRILTQLFGPPARWPFTARFWDGSVQHGASTRTTLILRRPEALRRMLLPPSELALGEAYLHDDFDVEGDLEAFVGLADMLTGRLRSPVRVLRLFRLLRALPTGDKRVGTAGGGQQHVRALASRHSRRRDAAAIRFHYDVGNDFYALWLDQHLVYSCAYFQQPDDDLDTAQEAKLEYLCRKLHLQPGERLLDIGCGFGGLIRYAAAHYGVQAVGITLSPAQAAMARQRITADGLGDRCRVIVCDYRALATAATFDKIVSVGMVEHVGRMQLPIYYTQAYRLLKPGGLFLNHGIVDLAARPTGFAAWITERVWHPGEFMQRYVFPDGELVTPADLIAPAEAAGFETRDLESLREHYPLTLRHWVRRLEEQHEEVVRLVGEQTYRIWRLYMAGSAQAFAGGRIGIVQALFGKPDRHGRSPLPLTRDDLYRGARGSASTSRRFIIRCTTTAADDLS